MDRERLPEQIEVLDEIAEICEREEVSVVLIAGDVFDTFLPSAEAEEVFYRALKKMAGDSRAVVAVSGNHDDGQRLCAGSPFAEEQGVYLFGGERRRFSTGGNRPVRAVASGEGWLILENGAGERVYVNALPYPNEARLKEEKTEESYSEKVRRYIERGDEGYRGDMPHILLSHLFVAGGKTSEGEREIDLGGARAVPASIFPENCYIALGHLHRKQKIGNARYSGSVLQYSFDEANTEKSVILLETEGLSFREREIPLRSGKKLVRLECGGFDEAMALLPRYEGCLIELTLRLSEPLTTQNTHALSAANEGLISLIAKVETGERTNVKRRAYMEPRELFTEYYRSQFGEAPKEELLSAFLTLLEEET